MRHGSSCPICQGLLSAEACKRLQAVNANLRSKDRRVREEAVKALTGMVSGVADKIVGRSK